MDEYLGVFHLRASPPPSSLFVSRQEKKKFSTDVVTPYPPIFFRVADLRPDEVEAIDKAGAQGPPGSTLSLATL